MDVIKGLIGSIIILIILGLVGCAQPTSYTKASSSITGYGYRDKRINGDEFSIVVLGNQSTSHARVAEIALLRAARLTKEESRTHFVIIKQKAITAGRAVINSIPMFVGGVFTSVPVGERVIEEPMAILLIRLLPLQAACPPDALNADEVIKQIAKHLE